MEPPADGRVHQELIAAFLGRRSVYFPLTTARGVRALDCGAHHKEAGASWQVNEGARRCRGQAG
jgi:hypothetical protein